MEPLPSDVARLVLGYLSESCPDSAARFLAESPDLGELRRLRPGTRRMHGPSLVHILTEHATACSLVEDVDAAVKWLDAPTVHGDFLYKLRRLLAVIVGTQTVAAAASIGPADTVCRQPEVGGGVWQGQEAATAGHWVPGAEPPDTPAEEWADTPAVDGDLADTPAVQEAAGGPPASAWEDSEAQLSGGESLQTEVYSPGGVGPTQDGDEMEAVPAVSGGEPVSVSGWDETLSRGVSEAGRQTGPPAGGQSRRKSRPPRRSDTRRSPAPAGARPGNQPLGWIFGKVHRCPRRRLAVVAAGPAARHWRPWSPADYAGGRGGGPEVQSTPCQGGIQPVQASASPFAAAGSPGPGQASPLHGPAPNELEPSPTVSEQSGDVNTSAGRPGVTPPPPPSASTETGPPPATPPARPSASAGTVSPLATLSARTWSAGRRSGRKAVPRRRSPVSCGPAWVRPGVSWTCSPPSERLAAGDRPAEPPGGTDGSLTPSSGGGGGARLSTSVASASRMSLSSPPGVGGRLRSPSPSGGDSVKSPSSGSGGGFKSPPPDGGGDSFKSPSSCSGGGFKSPPPGGGGVFKSPSPGAGSSLKSSPTSSGSSVQSSSPSIGGNFSSPPGVRAGRSFRPLPPDGGAGASPALSQLSGRSSQLSGRSSQLSDRSTPRSQRSLHICLTPQPADTPCSGGPLRPEETPTSGRLSVGRTARAGAGGSAGRRACGPRRRLLAAAGRLGSESPQLPLDLSSARSTLRTPTTTTTTTTSAAAAAADRCGSSDSAGGEPADDSSPADGLRRTPRLSGRRAGPLTSSDVVNRPAAGRTRSSARKRPKPPAADQSPGPPVKMPPGGNNKTLLKSVNIMSFLARIHSVGSS